MISQGIYRKKNTSQVWNEHMGRILANNNENSSTFSRWESSCVKCITQKTTKREAYIDR